MADQTFETRTPDQLPRVTAISPDALVTVQEEGGPVAAMAVKQLLGRLVQTDTAKETRADLLADLDHPESSVALVYADPDPAKNGWYRKTGGVGAGTWTQFEKLSAFAAAEIAAYVAQASDFAEAAQLAAAAAHAFSNFRATIAEGVAEFPVGEFFSSAETGALRVYKRIAIAPFYQDMGDGAAPLTKPGLALPGTAAGLGTESGDNLQHVLNIYVLPSPTTLTIGADQPSLVAALERLKYDPLRFPVTLQCPPGNQTPELTIPATGFNFENPNSYNVTIQGAPFSGGGHGTIINDAAMSGNKATDVGYVASRYPTVLLIDGDDTINHVGGGIEARHGLSLNRFGVRSKSRYSIASGYTRSHASAGTGGRLIVRDVAGVGGVWMFLLFGGTFVSNGDNFFGHQIDGGPIGAFGTKIEIPIGRFTCYAPRVASYATSPQYGLFLDNSHIEVGSAVTPLIAGYFLDAMRMNCSSGMWYGGLNSNGPTRAFTLVEASQLRMGVAPTITAADPANTALRGGQVQQAVPGNDPTGSIIHLGINSALAMPGASINNCIASRIGYLGPNSCLTSYPDILIDNCRTTVETFLIDGSFGHQFSPKVTNPKAGSIDHVQIHTSGGAHFYAHAGMALNGLDTSPTPRRWLSV